MKRFVQFILLASLTIFLMDFSTFPGKSEVPRNAVNSVAHSPDLELSQAKVNYLTDLDLLVFEQEVKGTIGKTLPNAAGQMDTAPVLGYVFPTTLKAEDIGFNPTEGIVALAITSHPDFDDTPLWDENSDRIFDNDGIIWHPHWVVLTKDERVGGGLAVKQFDKENDAVLLPPTNPGMPMYMDSPGFPVRTQGNTIRVVVPDYRMNGKTDFSFDAVSCYMQVNTSESDKPMLGVYEVYGVASGDLSLPYKVEN